MALPTNVGTGVVNFSLIDTLGIVPTGTIRFKPEFHALKNVTAEPAPVIILPKTVSVALVDGKGSATLIATDDEDNNPTGWTYTVSAELAGAQLNSFSIHVPEGSVQDLAELQPVASSPGTPILPGGGGVPPGGPMGYVLTKASNADYDTQWSPAPTGGGGGPGVTDHGGLSGLGDDDHPHYLNNSRGDARYYTQLEVDARVNNAAGQNSAADRNRLNHTGTQAISTVQGLQEALENIGETSGIPRVDTYTGPPAIVPHQVRLDFSPDVNSSDLYQVVINGTKKSWQNEWGALRGVSPYSWGDSLVRGIRENGDGITATNANFIELADRRTGAPAPVMYGRRWSDGALMRNGNLMADVIVLGGSDPVPVSLPAGTIIARIN